jgi:hypothetical protein
MAAPQGAQVTHRLLPMVGSTGFTVTAINSSYSCRILGGEVWCSEGLDYYSSSTCYVNGVAKGPMMPQFFSGSDVISNQSSASAWLSAIEGAAGIYAGGYGYTAGSHNTSGCSTT